MNLAPLNKNNEAGFTLLEVLIALAILIFICFAIFQATAETYKLRDNLTAEGDLNNAVILAMAVVQRDLNLIYSPKIAMPDKKPDPTQTPGQPVGGAIQGQDDITDDLAQTFTFWSAAINREGLRPSRLIGTERKLSFISLSHIRIYKEAPESEFAKVTYELRRDEKNKENPGTYVLIKTESPNAFSNEDRRDTQAVSYEVLHNIKSFTFSYHLKEGETWKVLNSWDTDHEDTKNLFPDIIEIKLEVLGPKNFSFEGDYKFRPEIPLNGLYPST
ncbi:MAG: type II secretion system protein [Bdellovibrionia bacterium]